MLEGLRVLLAGVAYVRGDTRYEAACASWDLGLAHRPEVVVEAWSTADIAAAVRFAVAMDMPVAVQNSGHGPLFCCDDGVLINVSNLRGVAIDAQKRIARVEPGARWRDVLAAAAPHGLAGLCGTSPNVGVVGYTLGGGTGWLARQYGYACDSVVAVEVVDGNGNLRRASETENPELFWAIRGGGSSFGAVTALEFRLYPVAEVYGGALFFEIHRAHDVFKAYAEWTKTVPETMTSTIVIQHIPPLPFVPEPLRGRSVVSVQLCFNGCEAEGSRLVEPLRKFGPMLDGVAMMPYSEVGRIANEPEAPMHTVTATQTLGALTPELMEQVLEATADPTHTTLLLVAFRHLEGAYRRLPEGASAVSRPDLDFLMIAVGVVMAPEARQKVTADAHRLVELTRPFQTGTPLRNFLTANSADRATGLELFVEAKYARLNEVKRRFDPANRFRFNIPLRPASETATAVA